MDEIDQLTDELFNAAKIYYHDYMVHPTRMDVANRLVDKQRAALLSAFSALLARAEDAEKRVKELEAKFSRIVTFKTPPIVIGYETADDETSGANTPDD